MIEAEAEAESKQLELLVAAKAEKEAAKENADKRLIENEAEIKIRTRDAENELAVKTRIAEAEYAVQTKQAEADFVKQDREAASKERMAQAEKEQISATGLAEVEVDRERAVAIKETGEARHLPCSRPVKRRREHCVPKAWRKPKPRQPVLRLRVSMMTRPVNTISG